jgi:Domain of unknown function (DUF6899)
MPYITENHRLALDQDLERLVKTIRRQIEAQDLTARPGLMNYALTVLIRDVYEIDLDLPPRYHEWNEIVGFMECAKLELYRKGVAPYEDDKEMQNGPVLTALSRKKYDRR